MAPADFHVRDGPRRRDGPRSIPEGPSNGQRHGPTGRGPQGQLRAKLRGAVALPADSDDDGGRHQLDDGVGPGVHVGQELGVRQRSAAAEESKGCREPEVNAAAGRRDADDIERRAGDRHRAGQPAGRVRAAVQHADGVRAAAGIDDGRRPGIEQQRRRGCGGDDRVHRWHRDRRSGQQQLLLRTVRLARRRLHVQRRLGRLLRPPRRRARRLDGSPRGHDGEPLGPRGGCAGKPDGTHRDAGRESSGVAAAAHRMAADAPGKQAAIGFAVAAQHAGAVRDRQLARIGQLRVARPEHHRTDAHHAGSQRHTVRRLLGVFERKIGTRGQLARTEQPSEQLAQPRRRRWTAPMTRLIATALAAIVLGANALTGSAPSPAQRTCATADEAVRALIDATKAGKLDELLKIFGNSGQELIESSDVATAKRNQEIFSVAAAEKWHLVDQTPTRKILNVGNEDWPFPVPLVKTASGWRFDTASGKEEVLARRIGRNEIAAIGTCRTYVTAQREYAKEGRDGKPAGLFAMAFRSDAGKHNGLYWQAARRERSSPLGDLVATASVEGRPLGDRDRPMPFYGYYFKILSAQGASAPGGAKSYIVNGDMSGGFALVAWPAQYDTTGVMTFIVNQDGVVFERDLGPQTETTVAAMTTYNPGTAWHRVR